MQTGADERERDAEAMAVLVDVAEERRRQDAKWGGPNDRGHGFAMWFPILMEEAGEASQAFLQERFAALRIELVQTAAVAVAMIQNLDHILAERRRLADVQREEADRGE